MRQQYRHQVPTPDDPSGPWLGGGGDDCERVIKLKIRGKLEDMGGGKWLVIGSNPKKFLYCDMGQRWRD